MQSQDHGGLSFLALDLEPVSALFAPLSRFNTNAIEVNIQGANIELMYDLPQ